MMIHIVMFFLYTGVLWPAPVVADDAVPSHRHGQAVQQQDRMESDERCASAPAGGNLLESVQLETSDMKLFEGFFESVLHAQTVLRKDHPQKDLLRGYCYRGFLIVVRQDLQQPRPTGWVQLNFAEQDAARLQEELQRSFESSPIFKLDEAERNKIVRFKLKPDAKRGNRKAIRLEVLGPEGFMLGFNQYKEAEGRAGDAPPAP